MALFVLEREREKERKKASAKRHRICCDFAALAIAKLKLSRKETTRQLAQTHRTHAAVVERFQRLSLVLCERHRIATRDQVRKSDAAAASMRNLASRLVKVTMVAKRDDLHRSLIEGSLKAAAVFEEFVIRMRGVVRARQIADAEEEHAADIRAAEEAVAKKAAEEAAAAKAAEEARKAEEAANEAKAKEIGAAEDRLARRDLGYEYGGDFERVVSGKAAKRSERTGKPNTTARPSFGLLLDLEEEEEEGEEGEEGEEAPLPTKAGIDYSSLLEPPAEEEASAPSSAAFTQSSKSRHVVEKSLVPAPAVPVRNS